MVRVTSPWPYSVPSHLHADYKYRDPDNTTPGGREGSREAAPPMRAFQTQVGMSAVRHNSLPRPGCTKMQATRGGGGGGKSKGIALQETSRGGAQGACDAVSQQSCCHLGLLCGRGPMLTATNTGTLTTQHQLLTDLRLESTRGGGSSSSPRPFPPTLGTSVDN